MLPRLAIPVLFVLLLSIGFVPHVYAQQTLENPSPDSFQSGVGVISGWACEAQTIEVSFDGGLDAGRRLKAGTGTIREDTQGVCGDTDNGFGLLYNWNRLGDGVHTVTAYADGVEFASVTVTVTTLGEEFRRGLRREVTIPDFPEDGTDVVLQWQEAQQNFVITAGSPQGGGTSGAAPHVLENPQPGSFQSGVGVISGWACEAQTIEVSFDGGLDAGRRLKAGTGTIREDTQGVCGDTDNGFGLLYNWNRLGDGVHTVTAYADGVEFASVTVTVTTLGEEFRRGLSREVTIPDFPEDGTDVVLQWQEAQQNFVITQLNADITRGPAEKMYWLDPNLKRIQRANLDGSQIETVYTLPKPGKHLAVDAIGGKLYWIDGTSSDTAAIHRANMDGTQTDTIVDHGVSGLIQEISIDQGARKLVYRQDQAGVLTGWWRVNLDGTQQESLPFNGYHGNTWAAEDGIIYYFKYIDGDRFLVGQDLAGSSEPHVIAGASDGRERIIVDGVRGKIYWQDGTRIQRANLDGSHIESLPVPIPDKRNANWAVDGNAIYWVEQSTGSLYRETFDPRARNLVISDERLRAQGLCATCAVTTMAGAAGHIYFGGRHITRYDIQGDSFRELTLKNLNIRDFRIDEVAGRLHILISGIVDEREGPGSDREVEVVEILSMDLTGAGSQTRTRVNQDSSQPYTAGEEGTEVRVFGPLDIDSLNGKLYWGDYEIQYRYPTRQSTTLKLYTFDPQTQSVENIWTGEKRSYSSRGQGWIGRCNDGLLIQDSGSEIFLLTNTGSGWKETIRDTAPVFFYDSGRGGPQVICTSGPGEEIMLTWMETANNTYSLYQGRLGQLDTTRRPLYAPDLNGMLGLDTHSGELYITTYRFIRDPQNRDHVNIREVHRYDPSVEVSTRVLQFYDTQRDYIRRQTPDALDEWIQDPQTWKLPKSMSRVELATQ